MVTDEEYELEVQFDRTQPITHEQNLHGTTNARSLQATQYPRKIAYVQKRFPVTKRRRRSAVGIVARLWTCRSGVRIPVDERDPSLLQNVHTGSQAHTASYSVGTGILYRGCGQGVKLTTHLHLAPRLRISETTRISTSHVCFHCMNTGDSCLLSF
jgi:hypothetical protein